MTRIWHAVLAAACLLALAGQTVLTVSEGRSVVNLYSYFTIQSNVLVLLAAGVIATRPEPRGNAWGVLRLAGLAAITVTGIVYATVLAREAEFVGVEWWYDKVFHYVVPTMAVLGFVLFRPRTVLARRHLVFLVWPAAWLGYTLVRAEVGTPEFPVAGQAPMPVPYGFLDASALGYPTVLLNAVLVTLLLAGLAAAYVALGGRDARAQASSYTLGP